MIPASRSKHETCRPSPCAAQGPCASVPRQHGCRSLPFHRFRSLDPQASPGCFWVLPSSTRVGLEVIEQTEKESLWNRLVSKEFGSYLWTAYLLETCVARILGIVAIELVKRLAPLLAGAGRYLGRYDASYRADAPVVSSFLPFCEVQSHSCHLHSFNFIYCLPVSILSSTTRPGSLLSLACPLSLQPSGISHGPGRPSTSRVNSDVPRLSN
jgi:hypothetical protein